MWMLSFVSDSFLIYIVNAILIAGAIGTFLTFFILHRVVRWLPALAPYHLILQIISIVLLIGGVYLRGGYGVEMSWREKVAELESKIKIAEEQYLANYFSPIGSNIPTASTEGFKIKK
jgi:hypothetical protein